MPAHVSDGDPHARTAQADHGTAHAGAAHVSHGNTQDAWTGTLILLVGSLLVCLGLVLGHSWLWIAGAVICLAGVVAWVGMHRAGMTKELW